MGRAAAGAVRLDAMGDDTHRDNIRTLHAPRREIGFDWHFGRYVLRYDDSTLQVEWQIGGNKRVSQYDLLLLSPLFVQDSTLLERLMPDLGRAGLTAAATLIVWFSVIRDAVPLLAPALGITALLYAGRALFAMKSSGNRTIICESGGDEVIDIPHGRVDDEQRIGFERGLRRAIEHIHKQWREGEI